MAIFCDEAGYTGYDLLEEKQPYFVYAAFNIEENEADEYLKYLIDKYRMQGEPKGANWTKSANGKKALIELFDKYSGQAQIVYHNKKYALACKFFEYVFEPTLSENSAAFYRFNFHRFISHLVYTAYSLNDSNAEDLFRKFQNLIKGEDGDGLFKLLASSTNETFITELLAEYTLMHRETVMQEIITEGKFDFWILDLAQTALHGLLAQWSMKLGALKVVIDVSEPLKAAVDRNPLYHELENELVYYDPFGTGTTALNFSLKEPVQFLNSKRSRGLQMADLFASSVYFTLMHPEDSLSAHVRSHQKKYIPKPHNLCIEPEPGVHFNPDSMEFQHSVYTLGKIVELSRISTENIGVRFSKMMVEKITDYNKKNRVGGTNRIPPKPPRKKSKINKRKK